MMPDHLSLWRKINANCEARGLSDQVIHFVAQMFDNNPYSAEKTVEADGVDHHVAMSLAMLEGAGFIDQEGNYLLKPGDWRLEPDRPTLRVIG